MQSGPNALEIAMDCPQLGSSKSLQFITVRRLLLHPFWLFLSLPGYVGWRLLSGMAVGPMGVIVGILLLIRCCLFIPLSIRTRTLHNHKFAERLPWVGLTATGLFFYLFMWAHVSRVRLLPA